jgi:hypothetical protein
MTGMMPMEAASARRESVIEYIQGRRLLPGYGYSSGTVVRGVCAGDWGITI